MNFEFITLYKLGVGYILVRYSDIITMEITPHCVTRIEFAYGEHLIVEQTPLEILKLIDINEQLKKLSENIDTSK